MYLCMNKQKKERKKEKTTRSVILAEIRVNGKIYYIKSQIVRTFNKEQQQQQRTTSTTKTTNDTTKSESVYWCFVYTYRYIVLTVVPVCFNIAFVSHI